MLAPFIARHWPSLAGAGGATVVLTLAQLAQPWPLKFVIDRLLSDSTGPGVNAGDAAFLALVAALVLGIAVVGAASAYIADVSLNRAAERIVHELRVAVYAHLQRLSLAYHHRRGKGDLVTRITGDVSAVGTLFAESLWTIVAAVLLLAGMATVTMLLDPLLALVMLAVVPLLAAVTFRFRRRMTKLARRQRAQEGEIASLAAETLSAMAAVKAFGSETFEHEKVAARSDARREIGVEAAQVEARFSGIVDVLGAAAAALVLVVGVFRVSAGVLTPGDLVVFVSYAGKTYRPLRDIARQAGKASRSFARAERLAEVLASDEALSESKRSDLGLPARAHGTVELRDVEFGYTPGRPALGGVSLTVAPGTRVAVVGPSGAGKSTLGALIARFYDPSAGTVLIDGVDVRELPLDWLRRQVGFLLQDTALFSGTIAENIAYAVDATRDEVVAAAKAARAHDFVESLRAGYDTELGPDGVGLSGGQRQRIGIARVLLRNPAILVLDEPTTGLDAATEAELIESLDELQRGRTVLLITHSIALARRAEQVVVLQEGRVAEQGAPEELLAHAGPFRELARRQSVLSSRRPRLKRRLVPAPDAGLPALSALLDEEAAAGIIERALDTPAVASASIREVEYVPGRRALVRYSVCLDEGACDVVARVAPGLELSAALRLAEPLARLAADRVPVRVPIGVDRASGALVHCVPLDPELPILAQPTARLAQRLLAAGISLGPVEQEPALLAYRPARSAALRLDGHVLKAYATSAAVEAAARGLEWSSSRGLGPSGLAATLAELRATAQPAIPGTPVPRDAAVDVAPPAAAFLRSLQTHPTAGLRVETIEARFDAAAEAAWFSAGLAPATELLVESLVEHLRSTAPVNHRFVPAHGDFNVSQMLQHGGELEVLDFDALCAASPSLDLASYAANLIGGREGDLGRAREALAVLLEDYGDPPPDLAWQLAVATARRAPSPFRLWKKHWPARVESILCAADEILREGALP
ncbi:MAG: transporter related [Thermoleophilia bacterium]|nr:transporter related [Thermoleophilia bacterium]